MLVRTHITLLLLLTLFHFSFAQVVINEISSNNAYTLLDEDGDDEDWIELYNNSTDSVNLLNYGLSDDLSTPLKWQFPDITVKPKSFLTVFASGKDRKNTFDHWETMVSPFNTWKYMVPLSEPDTNWRKTSFNDSGWVQGFGGIGYGDGDDSTIIAQNSSLYIRKSFNITDTSAIVRFALHIDYDDAFVVYLNNVEIARSNVGVNGTPPTFDELAYDEHEALMYQGMTPEEFPLDNKLLKSIIVNGTNVLALQCHNISLTSSDITILPFLSVGIKNTGIIYENIQSWFKNGIALLHTNFKIAPGGETVALSNPAQIILDNYTTGFMQIDNSEGREQDGINTWKLFGAPTPGKSNNTALAYLGYVTDPVFSVSSGFYTTNQSLVLSTVFPSTIIRYTTDGSLPDAFSPVYASPITVDTNKVIRAQCYSTAGNYLPGKIVTNSYFIMENVSLPVVSVSTNPDNLWDYNTGIYVLGPNAEPDVPYFNANFWQPWEVPAHVEYFDKQGKLNFELDAGIRINGGWSRALDQKSIRITARKKYGNSSIENKVFDEKNISSFKQLLLRNSGNDWNVTHFRDGLMHRAVHNKTFNEIQAFKPSIVFLNGEYWGVHNIREKISNYYLQDNHGVDPDSLDLLNFDGVVIDGDNLNFIDFALFVLYNNMADSVNYQKAKNMLDIENFCDHFITQTYYVNGDWPQNNIKYWRAKKADAKWRYILTDLDFGLGLYGSYTFNDLDRVITANNNVHSPIFVSLLQNTEFRNYFINRYADLVNTIFHPDSLKELSYQFRDSIKQEMPRHFDKWGGDMDTWEYWNIGNVLINFINNRPYFARNHIEDVFALNKQVVVTLKVYPENAGKIQISTITPGSYPFAGVYFDGVPVKITAIPNPGFEFSFWQSNILKPAADMNKSFTLNIDTNDVFTAYFYGQPDTPKVVINEINYSSNASSDAGDWVELYNYGTIKADLSGWTFKDSSDNNVYTFPNGTILYPGNYLVLYNDSVKFKKQFSNVTNIHGPFSFGLNSKGEWLRLYESNNFLHTSVTYGSTFPWPPEANGTGKTLELIYTAGNIKDPANWFAGCLGGSPGNKFQSCDSSTGIQLQFTSEFHVKFYPNPFRDKAAICVSLKNKDRVTIRILDLLGREMVILSDEILEAGNHVFSVDAQNLEPGIYLYMVKTSKSIICERVMLIGNNDNR